MACPHNPVHELLPVEDLPRVIFFDADQRQSLHFFIGGKPFLAHLAQSSPSDGTATVSYTHLDVYKRQGLHIPIPIPFYTT